MKIMSRNYIRLMFFDIFFLTTERKGGLQTEINTLSALEPAKARKQKLNLQPRSAVGMVWQKHVNFST